VPRKNNDAAPIAAEKTRLLSIADLDHRTRAAKNAMAMVTAMEADCGGADRLSAGQLALIRRAAVITVLLESQEASWLAGTGIDVAVYGTLVNSLNRLLVTIGLERRSRDVTPRLADYIASKAGASKPPAAPAVPFPPVPVLS
jgi:hypothetical protein